MPIACNPDISITKNTGVMHRTMSSVVKVSSERVAPIEQMDMKKANQLKSFLLSIRERT